MSKADNLAKFGLRTLLSARLAATATDLVINGLDADTLYRGTALFVPALDGSLGWQSRFVSGGAWDAGGSDYAYQYILGIGTLEDASATFGGYGFMANQDVATPNLTSLADFTLYTGSASKQAEMISKSGYAQSDGSALVTGCVFSRRAANGAIADIRFLNAISASGLAAGSRVFLEKLG